MRLTLAADEGLNAISCDRLLARLLEARTQQAPEITIDLRRATFVDPYGAACLALVAQHLSSQGRRLTCVLPSNEWAQQATLQMGLVQALRPIAELRNLARPGRADPGQASSLPLRPIGSPADAQEVVGYLVDLAQQRLGYDTGDVLDAAKVVSELCHNVVDHSGGQGLAVAHIYNDRQRRRFVALAVVDNGVGIRASLAQRHPEAAGWRHGEAIRRALGGLSSRQRGGGLGLRSVHAVVQRYGGRLSLRSGDSRLYAAANRQPRTLAGVIFPGTQASISFSQRLGQ